jgi:hypothetical protein
MRYPKWGSERCVKAGFNHGRQGYKRKEYGRQITRIEDKNAAHRAMAFYGNTE